MTDLNLSYLQKLRIHLFGRIKINNRRDPEWSGSLTQYAFCCPRHGIVTSVVKGWKKRIDCPECLRESQIR